MEEINSTDQNRSQLEDRIFELAESVPVGASDSDLDWLYSQQLDQFIDAWWALAKYYEEHSDTEIGVEAVSEYVYYARILRRLMCDSTLDPKLRQQAEDQMSALDSYMDEVIKEAGTNLNN
ncbi:MAG: hypothetical protein L0287_03795 [Anaerolineae bacterium]|nr:hypothetical protein [Anaerolineae bacterium]MCI0610515.1 hypothetical protein [Anaerolineae bacterium]